MPTPEKQPPDRPPAHELDVRSLRGLAHPLRMRLLNALRRHGPATASQLAERLGESSGATSYHLRQLAAYGFVEDDPERGKGRERWWRSAHYSTHFGPALYDDDSPETRGALGVLLHEVATIHSQELTTWIGTMRDWPAEWAKNADMSDFTLRLNPEQLRELDEKLHAVINSYADVAPGEGAARVRVHLRAFPQKND
ncbi:ArsR/SmtB family transcription factor [Streptomyces sp. SP18CS02]|uniref:ArsR/SmtB family transcription factor n=1 Tax=Streptomyces sp. SP18CS02 TaxID=3002531 RepID=UPI002E75E569|nr:helix-turn-helix domain-containing protein [Streptomyces sp. SP18CS02]MEE1752275.1 helix-turn-helix domain-containing protein [Streptomyces sp. SP18CS02]